MREFLSLLDDLLGWYHSRRTLRHIRAWKATVLDLEGNPTGEEAWFERDN